jgi:hypothetical protein
MFQKLPKNLCATMKPPTPYQIHSPPRAASTGKECFRAAHGRELLHSHGAPISPYALESPVQQRRNARSNGCTGCAKRQSPLPRMLTALSRNRVSGANRRATWARLKSLSASSARLMTIDAMQHCWRSSNRRAPHPPGSAWARPNECEKLGAASHALPNRRFWEA